MKHISSLLIMIFGSLLFLAMTYGGIKAIGRLQELHKIVEHLVLPVILLTSSLCLVYLGYRRCPTSESDAAHHRLALDDARYP
jgi:ABC-type dipeptide/oligopeptide/nickel transport system permease component